ncbi:MAG: hypothetical protein AAFV51_13885 [Pseudomonadota bacterium]
MTTDELAAALQKERLASYARLRGGFPIPLAGTTYWGVLAGLGYAGVGDAWYWTALFGSGAIFPLALFFAAIFRNPFMKDRTAVGGVLVPAFVSMLLFWPMAIAALWTELSLFPLILAIGLSIHWPVIGWSYGRPALFSAHSVIRAVVAFLIWWKLPDARLTLLPASVALIYFLTVIAIFIDSGVVKARLEKSAA